MNFDIKYATYLQISNFIKIKQDLDKFLGTQSWEKQSKDHRQFWVQTGDL